MKPTDDENNWSVFNLSHIFNYLLNQNIYQSP